MIITTMAVAQNNSIFSGGSADGFAMVTTGPIDIPLPIELVYFTANRSNNVVETTWETASEFNSDYFLVQRSADGIIFEELLRVEGSGNSNTSKKYSTIDEMPLMGSSFYRLKQIDFNGNYVYSKTVNVIFKKEDSIVIISKYFIDLNGFTPMDNLIIKTIDISGKELYSNNVTTDSNGHYALINNNVADGSYIISVISTRDIKNYKFIMFN